MLATLRRQSWTLILSDQPGKTRFDQNSIEPLLVPWKQNIKNKFQLYL